VFLTSRVRLWPELSRTDHRTVPSLVELVVPLNPLTQILDFLGGLMKSDRLLEIHDAVAPLSTSMLNESELKMTQWDPLSETAALARARPVASADSASNHTAACCGEQWQARHHEKFHLRNKYLRQSKKTLKILTAG
jgi:hypothetical protein